LSKNFTDEWFCSKGVSILRVSRFVAIGLSFIAGIALQATANARAQDASKLSQVPDACWQAVEAKYGITPQLMAGIAEVESAFRPQAVNTTHLAKTKSIDIGLAQINSRWLSTLSRFGITQKDLFDACTNLHVGGWILSDLFRKHGNTWEAVGAYNAACTQLKGDDCKAARSTYAWKVHKAMVRFFGATPSFLPSSLSQGSGMSDQGLQAVPLTRSLRIASVDFTQKRKPQRSTNDVAETSETEDEDALPPSNGTNSVVHFQEKGIGELATKLTEDEQ
jgi:Transglycosylase SLT domain